jgi:beta-lactamase class A
MWVNFLRDDISVDIDGLTNLMMNVSDNTATVMLSDHLGVENIERTLGVLGLKNTVVTINVPESNRRLSDLRRVYRNMGVTTPSEMATLLELIYRRRAASPSACEKMIRIMQHQYWDDFIRSGVPVNVAVAAKVGALNRSRSDSAIVFSPSRPYILTVYTDDQKNQEWVDDNPGNVAIRTISNLVWNRLHPRAQYTPPKDAKRFYPTGGGVE